MGTLSALLPITGILAGIIAGWLAKKEVKQGQKYLLLLQHALLGAMVTALFWQFTIYAIFAGIVTFILFFIVNFKHPMIISALTAIPAIIEPRTQIPVFLYLIQTGSLNTKDKNIAAAIIYCLIILSYHLFF